MKSILSILALVLFAPMFAFAQDLPVESFLAQVMQVIQSFGGLTSMAKVACVIGVVISSMKVSFLKGLLWDKLPALVKTLAAPALALAYGVLSMEGDLNFAAVVAYVAVGAGSVFMHELLDGLKTIPGIGEVYITIINLLKAVLGGKKE